MKVFAIGLVAAMLAAALSPAAASAADKPKPPIGDAKAHAAGMADTPPMLQQMGISCTPSDAYLVGSAKTKDAAGKDITTKYYEVACQEGLGWIVGAPEGAAPQSFDCASVLGNKPKDGVPDKGQLYCRLPANADPMKTGIQPIVDKAGVHCTVNQAHLMGMSTQSKFHQFEVGCAESSAYILQYPDPGSTFHLQAVDCLTQPAGTCQYFPKEKLVARVTALAQPAARPCQITNGRWMGATNAGDNFYEVACTDEAAGFVVQINGQGQYVKAIDCARAAAIANGCTLSAAVASRTGDTATYTNLAKQIGYACNVKAYHPLGLDSKGREVVELSCNDHPDGAVAVLPVDKGQTGEYWNCARAQVHGIQCVLNPEPTTLAKLTAEMSASGKHCTATKQRGVGATAEGDDIVEVLCSEGGGNFIEYKPGSDAISSVQGCGFVKNTGGGCKLTP